MTDLEVLEGEGRTIIDSVQLTSTERSLLVLLQGRIAELGTRLVEARSTQQLMLTAIGRAHDADINDGDWSYDAQAGTLKRIVE